MKYLFLLPLLLSTNLFGLGMPLLPIKQIEAEQIDYNEKFLNLMGNVSVSHEFGTIHCNKAILHLNDEKKTTNELAVHKILLYENVIIDFSDGSKLLAQEGEIDCLTMEGIFTSKPPQKVIYTSYAQDEKKKIPVRASGRMLRAKIIKTPQGHSLSSLKCDGAVNIEYLRPVEVENINQEKSE